jgi:hypothetical protein
MTEPLDLDALKAKWLPSYGWGPNPELTDLFAVIAELEATRATAKTLAERCLKAEGDLDGAIDECAVWADRAERAEAHIAGLEDSLRETGISLFLAEAAIARVEAVWGDADCPNGFEPGEGGCMCIVCQYRAALRGDA